MFIKDTEQTKKNIKTNRQMHLSGDGNQHAYTQRYSINTDLHNNFSSENLKVGKWFA